MGYYVLLCVFLDVGKMKTGVEKLLLFSWIYAYRRSIMYLDLSYWLASI